MDDEYDSGAAAIQPATVAIDRFSDGLGRYLDELSLPSADLLALPAERLKVFRNLPELVGELSEQQRSDAMYLSKFVAACGAGLFDAALNFVWDEVVMRLRTRVARFDLAYFFDTAVKDAQQRLSYNTEEDLRALSDSALIQGALKCGMVSSIAYKHLDYIRDMRNWASAAHPNNTQLTGLQLISWCETCVREVILAEPVGEVLEVGRLLRNLREQTLTNSDVPAVTASIRRLPGDLVSALLRSVVGHYCDPGQDIRAINNIKLVATSIWACASESAKGEVGLKYANFSANADVQRKQALHEFLDLVGGLGYLPESDLALEIAARVSELESAHDGFDNFYNEPPRVRALRKYISDSGLVPPQVNDEYVRVIVRCRVGRRQGVSNAAVPVYDELIDRFGDKQIRAFIGTLSKTEVTSRLDDTGCSARFRGIVDKLKPRIVDQPTKRVLDAINLASNAQLTTIWNDSRFQRLVAAL
jgi:hypothetical protein